MGSGKSQSELAGGLTAHGNRTLRNAALIAETEAMETKKPVFTGETFQFFKDLGRHNHKEWMEDNRDRYQAVLIQPFRRLLEVLALSVLDLDSCFFNYSRAAAHL